MRHHQHPPGAGQRGRQWRPDQAVQALQAVLRARGQHRQVLAHGGLAMAQGIQLEQRGAQGVGRLWPGCQLPVQRDAVAGQHAGQQFVALHAVGHQRVAHCQRLLQGGHAEGGRPGLIKAGRPGGGLQPAAPGALQQFALGAAQGLVQHDGRAALVLQALHAAVEPVQAVAQRRCVVVVAGRRDFCGLGQVLLQGAGAHPLQLPQHLGGVAAGQRRAQLLLVGAQVVGEEGAADLVTGQGAAARLEGFNGRLEVLAGGLRLAIGQRCQAQAGQAALLHRPLLQADGAGQRRLETAPGLITPAGQPQRLGAHDLGAGLAVGLAGGNEAAPGLLGMGQGSAGLAVGPGQFGPGQGHRGRPHRIAFAVEQGRGLAQRLGCGRGLAQQGLGAGPLGQRPGGLVGQFKFEEAPHRGVEQGLGLGQQAQLKIGVGELFLGDGQAVRHAQRLVAAARRRQAGQGLAVAAPGQVEQGHRFVDHRQLQCQPALAGTHAGPGVDAQRLVEIAGGGECVGQADVGQHRVGMVTQPGKQHGGLPVVAGGVGIGVAAELQRAQVLAHARGHAQVAQGQQLALGGHRAGGGLLMLAQHRQGHDLGHLGLRRWVGPADAAQAGASAVEQAHRLGHLAADHGGQAPGPVGQRGDLKPLGRRQLGAQQCPQGFGSAHGTRRLGAPGLVAQGLERPGQGQPVVGRAACGRCRAAEQVAGLAEVGVRGWAHRRAAGRATGRPPRWAAGRSGHRPAAGSAGTGHWPRRRCGTRPARRAR